MKECARRLFTGRCRSGRFGRLMCALMVLAVTACGGHRDRDPRISQLRLMSDAERTARCLAMSDDERVQLFFASRRRHHTYHGLDACFMRSRHGFLLRIRHEISEHGTVYEAYDLAVLARDGRRAGVLAQEDVAALDLWALCRLRGEEGPGGQPGACFEAARRAGQ